MTVVPPLRLEASASPGDVGRLRSRVRRWLNAVLDEDSVDDLTLAVSEALENAVDHAFVGRTPGTMTVVADCSDDEVVVAVTDDGRWQEPTTAPTTRGRGLALMRSLADSAEVATDDRGTSVRLVRRRSS